MALCVSAQIDVFLMSFSFGFVCSASVASHLTATDFLSKSFCPFKSDTDGFQSLRAARFLGDLGFRGAKKKSGLPIHTTYWP